MDDGQLRADLAQAKRAAQANGQALSEKVAELAYARPMADAGHLVAKLWDAVVRADRQYSYPSMSLVAALDALLDVHRATTPSEVPSSHVIVERAELERLRELEKAARAFDRDFPDDHRIHPQSPAVLGLQAALRAGA